MSATTNATRSTMIITVRTAPGNCRRSSSASSVITLNTSLTFRFALEAAHKVYQRFYFLLIHFVTERRHIPAHAAPVRDRVEDAFVGRFVLPFRIREVARVAEFALLILRASIAAVTLNAVPAIQLRRRSRVRAVCLRGKHGDKSEKEQYCTKSHHKTEAPVASFVYSAKNFNRR
jgi:hypothetical protein